MTETTNSAGVQANLHHITDDHRRALAYHPLTPGRGELHEELRAAAMVFTDVVDRICPGSREASMAFSHIQEGLMCANAALAIHDPNAEPG